MKKVLFACALAAILSACSDGDKKTSNNTQGKVTVSSSESAEKLAQAGEYLIAPASFPHALELMDMALEKDSNNQRAQFYAHLLKPIRSLEGIYSRLESLAAAEGKTQELQNAVKEIPDTKIKEFLTKKGGSQIRTEKDVQDLLASIRDGFESLRQHMKSSREIGLTLYLNPDIHAKSRHEQLEEKCEVSLVEGKINSVTCDTSDLFKVRLDSSDKIAVQQIAAIYSFYFGLYNHYSLEGLRDLAKDMKDGEGKLTAQEMLAMVQGKQGFLTLRQDQKLGSIQEMGIDGVVAARWLVKYQDQLCNPQAGEIKRKGMLFEKGLCLEKETDKSLLEQTLSNVQMALTAPFNVLVKDEKVSMENRNVQVNLQPLFAGNIKSLKTFLPAEVNSCGKALRYADMTFGGLIKTTGRVDWDKSCE